MNGTSNNTTLTDANTSIELVSHDTTEASSESASPAQAVDSRENLEAATATATPSTDGNGSTVTLRAQLWKRRNMVTALLSLAAGAGFVMYGRWSDIFPKPPAKRTDHPYFRKNKRAVLASAMSVLEGFYERKLRSSAHGSLFHSRRHRSIAQYVQSVTTADNQKQNVERNSVPFVSDFSKTRVRIDDKDGKLPDPTENRHVNYSRSSAQFELAALRQVSLNNYDAACEFLIKGIQHDLMFKKRTHGAPSIRLWDLLAKVSVRSGHPEYLTRALTGVPDQSPGYLNEMRTLIARQEIGAAPKRRHPKKGKGPTPSENRLKQRQAQFEKRVVNWQSEDWRKKMQAETSVHWAITLRDVPTVKKDNKVIYTKQTYYF